MSRRTPEAAMIEDIHARVKCMSKERPFMDCVERTMTDVGSGFEWHDPTIRDRYIAEHNAFLGHIRRVFHPLIDRPLSISSQLGLWDGEQWIMHMADYAPHGVRGDLAQSDGFMIKDSYSSFGTSVKFHFCLVMSGADLVVYPDEPGINLAQYDLSQGVLVPVQGLGGGWFQQINRIVNDGGR